MKFWTLKLGWTLKPEYAGGGAFLYSKASVEESIRRHWKPEHQGDKIARLEQACADILQRAAAPQSPRDRRRKKPPEAVVPSTDESDLSVVNFDANALAVSNPA